jgi:hypothetical protein
LQILSATLRIESITSYSCSVCMEWIPCSVKDFVNSVRHSLRMVDLDVVIAAGDDEVLCVRNKSRESVLRLVPRTVIAVAEVRRHEGGQLALRDQGRDERPHGMGAGVAGQHHDRQGGTRWRGGVGLGYTGVEIEAFHGRVLRQLVLRRAGDGLHNAPLLGRHGGLPLRSERIDEHEAGNRACVLASVEPRDQATVGVANQEIGTRLTGGSQEGMQIPDRILCRGRLRDRSAATRHQVVAHECARPVIGAHPREPCDPGEDS